jgi:hypothetical protein
LDGVRHAVDGEDRPDVSALRYLHEPVKLATTLLAVVDRS